MASKQNSTKSAKGKSKAATEAVEVQVVPSNRKLRIAFIGAGAISQAHAKELQKFDDVEIVAAADVASGATRRHGGRCVVPRGRRGRLHDRHDTRYGWRRNPRLEK